MMTRWLGSGLIAALLFMQYQLWFMPGGLTSVWHLSDDIQQLEQKNHVLHEGNQAMLANIHQLKNGHHAIEAEARNELGMIKRHEVFYQVIDD
ncbi:MAG: cell division protein FtsB [Legionellales bacterium]|nr:cell division protein FtsB [Legionellales bacterium]HAG62298.1 cell division protein FtsB [Coxiellaceae bacterium]|tara:strand:+ start:413 stop:691 length:279 start_codon:yes stop_codon:yes gene_type:complete